MNLRDSSSCAITELENIRLCKTPADVIYKLCDVSIGKKQKWHSNYDTLPNTFYAFYFFSFPVGASCYLIPCGHNLATYIREQDLGELWESPAIKNEVFHPDHKNVVWVWMPNVPNLRLWWEKHGPTKPIVVPKVAAAPVSTGLQGSYVTPILEDNDDIDEDYDDYDEED